MNKFYDQYKGLFVDESKSPYIKQSLANYNTNIPGLSSPYTVNKSNITQNNNYNSNQNELKSLFKKYADRQFHDGYVKGGNKSLESVASKELSNVILPKLKMYDQEIDNKLKRFKTQHQEQSFLSHNYSAVYHNNYSLLQHQNNYSNVNNRNQHQQQHSRYKHGYKFKTPSNNIFHKDYQIYAKMHNHSFSNQQHNYNKQLPKKSQVNSVFYPKYSNNRRLKKEHEDDLKVQDVDERQIDKSRIKRKSPIFYMKHNPQENLQTEYQRSYSNKKIPNFHQDQHLELISSKIVQKSQIIPKNFHQLNQKQQISPYKTPQKQKINLKQQIKIDDSISQSKSKQAPINSGNHLESQAQNTSSKKQTPIKPPNNNNHHIMTQPSSPQHPSRVKHYQSLKQSRKASIKPANKRQSTEQQSMIIEKQQGMKFSQYQNQYAFINRRLQDIYNFNNFYSHKYINSYKLAIMNRLEAKRKVEERRNRMRYMLEKEALEFEEMVEPIE